MSNTELPSRKTFKQEAGAAFTGCFLFLVFIAYESGITFFHVVLVTAYTVSASVYWFTYLLKPAAWIENNVLSIKAWPLGRTTIPLNRVESIVYEPKHYINSRHGKQKIHKIKVKLPKLNIWEIPISDQSDHIKDMRLYRFILSHYPDIKLKK